MSEELTRHKAALDVAFKALNLVATATDVSLTAVNTCAETALAKIAEIFPPELEDVIVGSWFIIPTAGDVYTQVSEARALQMQNEGYPVAFLSATVKRPVRRAVIREYEVAAKVAEDGDAVGTGNAYPFSAIPECHGKAGVLVFRTAE